MNETFESLLSNPITQALVVVVAILAIVFLWQVFISGVILAARLRGIGRKISSLSAAKPKENKNELSRMFAKTRWNNLWKEFEDTLHEQMDTSGPEVRVTGVRATVPAESFFHVDALVDGPLHAEFYRHLPGILTGIGIIGTFLGLITGLLAFDPNAIEPEALKKSLGGLFSHVRVAFVFSAMAIGLAMLFTVMEKVVYAVCVHYANGLALAIDGLFRTGVGEEYLSQLVRTSEESATQTRQLKESLVKDLTALLTNLTEQQIAATQKMSAEIGTSIETSLKGPLKEIGDAVRTASGEQASGAAHMLENLMVSFMAQMRETLGGQLGDLSGLMQKTADAVGQVEATMRGLVADMQKASEASSTGVQAAMQELLSSLAEHQRQQGASAAEGQTKLLSEMQMALLAISKAQEDASRQARDAAIAATNSIGDAATGAINAGNQSSEAARALLAKMEGMSTEAITGLERGATKINATLASLDTVTDRLGKAGAGLVGLQDQALQASKSLEGASSTLGTGAYEVSKAMTSMGQVTTRLDGVATLMTTEAQTRAAMLKELQTIIQRSEEASKLFGKLSEEVQAHLTDGVARFGKATNDVLNTSLNRFDKELKNAADLLASSMTQLGSLAADIQKGQGK